jgi:hypothetical protein
MKEKFFTFVSFATSKLKGDNRDLSIRFRAVITVIKGLFIVLSSLFRKYKIISNHRGIPW